MRLPLFQASNGPSTLDLTTRRHGWRSFPPRRELANTDQKYQMENDMALPLLNRKRPDQEVPAETCGFEPPANCFAPTVFLRSVNSPLLRHAIFQHRKTAAPQFPATAAENRPAGKHALRQTNLPDCL